MIQCKDCEFCHVAPDGNIELKCHPFQNIKEPECLTKWQLLKLDTMVRAYLVTVAHYKKLAPIQEKMIKMVEQEMSEMDEGEKWKLGGDDDLNLPEPPDEEDEGTPKA